MAKVNTEGTNTDAMFAHQLRKGAAKVDTTKQVEVELGVEESSGKKVFDFRLTACLNARANTSKEITSQNKFATVEQLLVPQDENPILVSDADSQLLIKVFFQEKVNVNALTFRCDQRPTPEDCNCADLDPDDYQPPLNVRIFTNQESLDFSDTDDYKPHHTAELKLSSFFGDESPPGGQDDKDKDKDKKNTTDKIVLAGPKFQRINSLQIFIVDAREDAPYTFLNYLGITGVLAPDYHTAY